jgi:iron complex transport system permease protein
VALAAMLLAMTALLMAAGLSVGSAGWEPPWGARAAPAAIAWDIRLPRTLGAWLAGALLALAGAVAQGLFRNPLADPYLLGSASGAHLGVATALVVAGSAAGATGTATAGSGLALQLGLTGAAFVGAALAVLVTLTLARGVQHTLRLLLAGVVVGMVLGAFSSLLTLWAPQILRAMQAFMLGTTSLIGWPAVGLMAPALLLSLVVALACSRALDALVLGETTARSLGLPLAGARLWLVAAIALATGAAVAQAGLVPFVGLVAPHLVRAWLRAGHRVLLPLSALAGGALLLAADILGRGLLAPQEIPVGILTALLGGVYLLVLMQGRRA